jgi:mono/diheme cytochrome c family protein
MIPRRRLARVHFVATLLWSAAAATAGAADGSPAAPSAGIGSASVSVTGGVSGSEVYEHICQGCHMPQAEGAIGAGHYPKLAGDPALVSWQYVALTVLNGKNGMPGFGLPADQFIFGAARLSDAQVAGVVNYVRSHFGNKWKGTVTSAQVAGLPHPR